MSPGSSHGLVIRLLLVVAASFAVTILVVDPAMRGRRPVGEVDSSAQEGRSARAAATRPDNHRSVGNGHLPEVSIVERPASLTLREKMILAEPHAAYATWGAVEMAERELIQSELTMLLGDGHTLGIDCFEADRMWPEFTYELGVRVTPKQAVVGGFRITSDNLPRHTQSCMEAIFAGEVTIDAEPPLLPPDWEFTPFETKLERTSNFVERLTSELRTSGREQLLQRVDEAVRADGF